MAEGRDNKQYTNLSKVLAEQSRLLYNSQMPFQQTNEHKRAYQVSEKALKSQPIFSFWLNAPNSICFACASPLIIHSTIAEFPRPTGCNLAKLL